MPAPAFSAAAEPTLTIRPSPEAFRWGRAARLAFRAVVTFRACIRSQAGSASSVVCQTKPPAMFSRASSRPKRPMTAAIAWPACAGSVRSTPPTSSTPSGVAWPMAWSMTATFSPSAIAASSTARPSTP
mgnify:CR=1 FL=1